jgi:hypothetical protein
MQEVHARAKRGHLFGSAPGSEAGWNAKVRLLGTDVSGRIWLTPRCCRGSSGGMIEMPPQCTEMGMKSYDCSGKACDCGKRGVALSDFRKNDAS